MKSEPQPRMIDVAAIATMLGVSSRHVYRLVDSGRMPRPCKLGGANRWDSEIVIRWISDGCPSIDRRQT